MSLFHKHEPDGRDPGDAVGPADAASFEVLEADGKVVRYAREEFDEILETTDPDEVQRQCAPAHVRILTKPFQLNELLATVRSILDQEA